MDSVQKFEIALKSGKVTELDMSIFEVDSNTQMVNLNKIAESCGRKVYKWWELESSKRAVDAIAKRMGVASSDIWSTVQGGDLQEVTQGTWAHRKVAILFAQWISPDFQAWCIDALDELFQTGKVELKPMTQEEMLLNVLTTLQAQVAEQKAIAQEAIRTKAYISDKKVASALNTASQAVKKVNKLEIELDRSKEYRTIKGMELRHKGYKFDWRPLKKESVKQGLAIIKVFDANYGEVSSYHKEVWDVVYPNFFN
jgi:hypothetical protein